MPFENAVLYILLYGTAECFIRFDKCSTNTIYNNYHVVST